MKALDGVATALLEQLSPSGALLEVANQNWELDKHLDHFDEDELALKHLVEPSLVARLEDDFARCVPAIADAAVPVEAYAIPMLAALAGPAAAPFLSFGLLIACKVAIAALEGWSKKRLATKKEE